MLSILANQKDGEKKMAEMIEWLEGPQNKRVEDDDEEMALFMGATRKLK